MSVRAGMRFVAMAATTLFARTAWATSQCPPGTEPSQLHLYGPAAAVALIAGAATVWLARRQLAKGKSGWVVIAVPLVAVPICLVLLIVGGFTAPCVRQPVACEGLREVPEVMTLAEANELGTPTQFVDEGMLQEDIDWDGHGNQDRRGRLGPLQVRYTTTEYKGHSITTGVPFELFDPACPESRVKLRLGSTIDQLFLWHDVAHSRYIVNASDGRLHVFRSGPYPRPSQAGPEEAVDED